MIVDAMKCSAVIFLPRWFKMNSNPWVCGVMSTCMEMVMILIQALNC